MSKLFTIYVKNVCKKVGIRTHLLEGTHKFSFFARIFCILALFELSHPNYFCVKGLLNFLTHLKQFVIFSDENAETELKTELKTQA